MTTAEAIGYLILAVCAMPVVAFATFVVGRLLLTPIGFFAALILGTMLINGGGK
jgi:hypothetical protein